eukprot:TRINITY_DN11731_c0_g1_i4.p3 TRINITY_DN11731_c0_g1~~TRINITY_DN11731_c0_g1_i4.p3  ORF type:complete len:205 (-),score=-15.59 TRINITY_DN11731_c0_g1_i4:1127-1741(-)
MQQFILLTFLTQRNICSNQKLSKITMLKLFVPKIKFPSKETNLFVSLGGLTCHQALSIKIDVLQSKLKHFSLKVVRTCLVLLQQLQCLFLEYFFQPNNLIQCLPKVHNFNLTKKEHQKGKLTANVYFWGSISIKILFHYLNTLDHYYYCAFFQQSISNRIKFIILYWGLCKIVIEQCSIFQHQFGIQINLIQQVDSCSFFGENL